MGAQLSPTAPYVRDFVLSVCGRVEIAPGIFRRISPVTGQPETHITPEGLRTLRRRQRAKVQIDDTMRQLEDAMFEAGRAVVDVTAALAQVRDDAQRLSDETHFLRNYDRAEALTALRARCAGHVRRQGRVRR